jgi:dienelactone hydrolase
MATPTRLNLLRSTIRRSRKLLRSTIRRSIALASVGLSFASASPDRAVVRRPIRESGLVGTLFTPSDPGNWPAVITLTGAGGGIEEAPARALAEEGFSALALATHNAKGLPRRLENIPLEYCQGAIEWMLQNTKPNGNFIAVRGWSRGGELALIVGAMFSSVKAVLAYAPRTYVGLANPIAHNHCDPAALHAWTWRGKPLVFEPLPAAIMEHPEAPTWEDRFGIPVERIGGPIIFASGTMDTGICDDPVVGCRRAMRRLDLFHFSYRHEHWVYAGAGHHIASPPPFREYSTDGTVEGTSRAVAESWPKSLEFLRSSSRL